MKALGIDLGTRYTRAALVQGARIDLLEHPGCGTELPSIVTYSGRAPVIGAETLARGISQPESTVPLLKLLLGRPRTNPAVEVLSRRVGFPILAAGTGIELELGGATRTPESVLAALLGYVAAFAMDRLGGRPERTVISISPWMSEEGRRAVVLAAKRAGLEDAELVLDTTAVLVGDHAALSADEKVAVVDVGAGGTSVALYSAGPSRVELVASSASEAGGEAADELLLSYAWRELAKLGPVSPDLSTREMTRQAIERLKRNLSTETEVYVPIALKREQLETLLAPVLARVEGACRRALEAAKITGQEVERVLLGGGLSAMPALLTRVARAFGTHRPITRTSLTAVAAGAARLAGSRVGAFSPIVLREVAGPWPTVQVPPSAAGRATGDLPRATGDLPRPSFIPSATGDLPRTTGDLPRPSISPSSVRPAPSTRPPSAIPAKSTDDLARVPPGTNDLALVLTQGRFENPLSAGQLLGLPLVRRLGPKDLERVPLPVLLFSILARQKKTGTLTLATRERSVILPVVKGAAFLKKPEHGALLNAFRWPAGDWSFDPQPPELLPSRSKHGIIRIVMDGLRSLGRTIGEEEYRQAFGDRLELAPVVPEDLASDLERMGLTPAEVRVARTTFDGKSSLADLLTRAGTGRHSTLLVAAMLHVFDYLDWKPVRAKAR